MSKKIARRAVIAGTVVALLLVTGGFVAAATLGGITASQTGQNAGTITLPPDSIFETTLTTTVNIQLVQTTTTACGASATWGDTANTANVYVDGTATCFNSGTTEQWFEELSWSGVPVPGGGIQSDTFYITTTPDGSTYTYAEFTVSDPTTTDTGFTGALNVYLAAGTAIDGALPNEYNSISIVVSGT